ncbi:MAG: LysR family transcriptional regulator [Lachnospiraceae bacterium]|nr:LysR family transcriptional regulator [Lachnospiraceae bacterium]
MNERQLKYFLEVYTHKSISKAAQNLYVSPQGVSKTISSLEDELGLKLFKHGHNKIQPTADAALFAVHAQNILNEFDVISNKLFKEKNTIMTLPVYCSYDVPQLIPTTFFKDFVETYPHIRLCLREFPDEYIIQKIEKNEVELAIVPGPFDPTKITSSHLCTEDFCVVISKENPLSKEDHLSLTALSQEPIVIKNSMSYTSLNQIYSFIQSQQTPNIILETSDVHLIHQMAENNCAIGVSLRYLANKIKSDKIKVMSFEEDWLTKKFYIIYNKTNILSSQALAFKNALQDFYENQI